MEIHVVQPGDTIKSIAGDYGVSENSIIQNNGLNNQDGLVIGQSIIIIFPQLTYTVQEGDTLLDIANSHNVSVMDLLRNNPYLSERQYLYPGDIIVITYKKIGTITTHGHAFPYIDQNTLRKILPYLTYLSIINYSVTNEGDIISYYDEIEMVEITKAYGVMPLMLLTTLTIRGQANVETAYELLLNEELQDRYIENMLTILRTKGYYGVNVSFQHINLTNIPLYEEFYTKVVNRLNQEGYQAFVTINPNITIDNNDINFARIDYSVVNQLAHNVIFMNYQWGINMSPPSPIISVKNMEVYLAYLKEFIPTEKIIIGISTIGYDWELPYSAGISSVNALNYNNAIELARMEDAVIQFDEESQTPYFRYSNNRRGIQVEHIVWFIDARSVNSILELVVEHNLLGSGIWNIMNYNSQLWVLINSQFDIEKILI